MNWGLYLLPSLFTTANSGLGLYSILCSINGEFTRASWAILIAIVFDGFDGAVARITKTTSRMGVMLDSFADYTSFCVAPAVLMYFIVLEQYRTPGLIVAFVFIMFGTFRLARFNLKALENYGSAGTKAYYFEGLPTPAAGGILAAFVLMFELFQRFEMGITAKAIPLLMKRIPFLFKFLPVVVIVLSFLMVSKIRYSKFSTLKFTKRVPLRTFVLVLVAILLISAYPESTIFIIFFIYILSGFMEYFWRAYNLRRKFPGKFAKDGIKG
jgi:CDP-diacylglycerol---serine O-phosphatidyltransferase